MTASPRLQLSGIVLDSPDARTLADFYERLLGWPRSADEEHWVKLQSPDGGAGLSFQTEPDYRRPSWPSRPVEQQMSVHLDIGVAELDEAVRHAVTAGAELAEFQPQDDVRVMFDPAGHPFCLFLMG